MAVSLFLLPVFEQHRYGKNQKRVDAHYTECSSKDGVEEVVCICRKRFDASDHGCRNLGVRTYFIEDERRRSAVEVTATIKLIIVSLVLVNQRLKYVLPVEVGSEWN